MVESDEYLAPRVYLDQTLRDSIQTYDEVNIAAIYFPWIIYGDSEQETQPESVVDSFVNRLKMTNYEFRSCVDCVCTDQFARPQLLHTLGDGYVARLSTVERLLPRAVQVRAQYEDAVVSSRFDPYEHYFEKRYRPQDVYNCKANSNECDDTNLNPKTLWNKPDEGVIVSYKFFFQSKEYWMEHK